MTGKLIKYEFRSAVRQMWIFWAAAPVLALLSSFVRWGFNRTDFFRENAPVIMGLTKGLTGFAYGAVVLVMIVLTVMVVLSRFYNGLLGQEGYLMHTLPAKTWQLITAKGVTACCVILLSGIAALVSVICLGGILNLPEVFRSLGEFIRATFQDFRYLLLLLELLILGVGYILRIVYQLYASMSIGQIFDRHRILATVGAYIAISIAMVTSLTFGVELLGDSLFLSFRHWYEVLDEFGTIQLVIGMLFLMLYGQVAIFHIVSERLLAKKLNLL